MKTGTPNLSPYSFFNAFASKPPIVAIGPAIAARTGQPKDTWLNILAYERVHDLGGQLLRWCTR